MVNFNILLEKELTGQGIFLTAAKLAGRLPGTKLREPKQSSAYFAVTWAAAFPLLSFQRKRQEEKDLANRLMLKTLVEIAHTELPEPSKMASMLIFESLSTVICLQFFP